MDRPVAINISGISVAGVGGLGMVAIAALVTWVMPEAWWLAVFGATGGVVLATALVLVRRHYKSSGPSGSDPAVLFRAEASTPNRECSHPVPRADVTELATP